MGKVEAPLLLLLTGEFSAEICVCLDAAIAKAAEKVFGDCGASCGDDFAIACANGRDSVPARGVVRGAMGWGARLDAEIHVEGEPFPDCDELTMMVGAIGGDWGRVPGDAGEGHVDVLAARLWSAPDHGREDRAAGYGRVAAMPIELRADADVLKHQASAYAGDAGGSHGHDGAMGTEADAVGGGADGVLGPESCNDVGRPKSRADVEAVGDAGAQSR